MSLLAVTIATQVVALIATGFALHLCFHRSVGSIVEKNSIRMDGTFSRRRHHIEEQSARHSCRQIYFGLFFIFVISVLILLVVAGVSAMRIEWNLELSKSRVLDELLNSFRDEIDRWQWPLMTTYVILTLVVFPPFVFSIYRRCQQRYLRHANCRFMNYYRMESEQQMRHASEIGKQTNSLQAAHPSVES